MKKYTPFVFLIILLGTCLLTACSKDDNPEPSGIIPDSVDLGLSVNWASCNIGAEKPEDLGGYYQWAGTQDVGPRSYHPDWTNCPYHTGTSNNSGFTKYNSIPSYGTVDNKTVLDAGDDVANKVLGGKWRIPTYAEWMELLDNCTWTWTKQNDMCGYKVVSNKPGFTDKYIFLPAAGCRHRNLYEGVGYGGSYWSSSLSTDTPRDASSLFFTSGEVKMVARNCYRYYGFPVRPVEQK